MTGRAKGGRRGSAWLLAAALALALPSATALASDGSASGAVEADSPPFLGGFLRETRIVYPLRVGEWEAVGERVYDAAELGASVRYQVADHTDRWIDVFFYPVGVVPRTHLQQAALAVVQEVTGSAGANGWSDVDAGPLRAFTVVLPDAREPLAGRSADFRLARDEAVHSAMALAIDRMYYVKGRFTIAAAELDRDATRVALERFVGDVIKDTYIGSTGGCWAPPAVEALPAGAPAPDGATMAVGEGDDGAWLLEGRVLARDPQGAPAQALALLAMAAEGRLYPGCVGADPHNPDVPEGKREIRLEYRAPVVPRGEGGWRLGLPRAGVG